MAAKSNRQIITYERERNPTIGVSTGNSNGETNRQSKKSKQDIIMRMLLLIPQQRNQNCKKKIKIKKSDPCNKTLINS